MRSLFIATASALLFAAVITELFMRLWPGEYFALLVLAFIALLVSGLLNLRLAGWPRTLPPAAEPNRSAEAQRSRQGQRRPQAERDTYTGRPAADRPARAAREPGGRDKIANADVRHEPSGGAPPGDLPRETGTVKWFNRTKGFGFIIRTSGEEIFVHQRSIRFTGEGENRRRPVLRDGQAVSFIVAEREKGLQAEDVVPED